MPTGEPDRRRGDLREFQPVAPDVAKNPAAAFDLDLAVARFVAATRRSP